jgi:DME family drug/metabolite transporter
MRLAASPATRHRSVPEPLRRVSGATAKRRTIERRDPPPPDRTIARTTQRRPRSVLVARSPPDRAGSFPASPMASPRSAEERSTADDARARAIGRLQVLGAALLFSTGGAAVKSCAMPAAQIAGLRSAVAVVALLVLVPRTRRALGPSCWPTGVAYAATLTLFVLATRTTTAANAIFLQSTAPFWVVLLGPLLLHEAVARADLAVLGAIACGIVLLFVGADPPTVTAPDPALGNLLGAACGLTWAFTVLGLRALARDPERADGAASATVVGSALSAAVGIALVAPWRADTTWIAGSATDWLLVSFLGVFQIGAAYALLTAGMRRIPAVETALLTMAEPALNPVWTYLVHSERPGPLATLGGIAILGAVLARTLGPWLWRVRRPRGTDGPPL